MMLRNSKLVKSHKYIYWLGLTVFFVLGIWMAKCNSDLWQSKPLVTSLPLVSPAFAVHGADGNNYIVDNSFQRIIKTDPQEKILRVFLGGSTKKNSFYNCSDLAVDRQGFVYLSNVEVNITGMALNKESILQYNPDGSFKQEIFVKNYSANNSPLLNGWISCVQEINNEICFVYKEQNGVALYQIKSGKAKLLKNFNLSQARKNIINTAIAADLKSVVAVTKNGKIIRLTADGQENIYQGYGTIGDKTISVPWDVALYERQVVFTDLGDRQIKKITADGRIIMLAEYSGKKEKEPIASSPIYKRLAIDNQGKIKASDTFSIIDLNIDGNNYKKTDRIAYTQKELMQRTALYLFFLIWILVFSALSLFYLTKIKIFALSPMLKNGILIFTVSLIISVIIGFVLIKQFNQTIDQQIINNVTTVTKLSSELLDGNMVEDLNSLDDYNNSGYQQLSQKMNAFINHAAVSGDNLYYVIYKTDGSNVYQCMDYIGSGGLLQTMDTAYSGSYYEKVMKNGEQVKINAFQDSTGVWTYAVGPVYNSQKEIVAAIEIGRNLSVLAANQKKFILNTVINIIVITIIIFLVFTEFLYLIAALKKKFANKKNENREPLGLEIVRPLTFTLFIADYLQTAFLPIYVASLYTPIWGLPKSLAIAIPLSAEVFTGAISAVIAGYLKGRLSLKKIFFYGSWPVIIGFILCALSSTILTLTISKLIVGIGMGFLYVATSTMIAEQRDEETVSKGYSDYYAAYFSAINVGCVIGGGIATLGGYRLAFWFAAGISLLAFMLTNILLQDIDIGQNEEYMIENAGCSLRKFIFNPSVFSLLFAIYIPYLIGSYFLYYFFPLFAFEQGLSESSISHIFLLNGLFVVYLGPLLTPWIKKIFGVFGGTLVGSLLCLVGFAAFIFKPELFNAIITVILLGIADSFAYTMQTTYYTGLKYAHDFGLSKANGIKNTMENVGYTLAPFVFGSVLICGNVVGVAIIAGGMALGTAVFIFCGYKNNSERG